MVRRSFAVLAVVLATGFAAPTVSAQDKTEKKQRLPDRSSVTWCTSN